MFSIRRALAWPEADAMFNPYEFRLSPPPQLLLLVWWTLTALVAFGVVVSVDHGLMQEMLGADRSQICLVVMAMYLIGLGHTYVRTRLLSRELDAAEHLVAALTASSAPIVLTAEQIQLAGGVPAAPGFLSSFLREHFGRTRDADASAELLEAYASRLRGTTEFGWFFIDLMLKVGFLGTLVGFILMLSSVADTGSLDANTMQKILRQMSVGMSTALYTTLASLVGGILLSIPYYLHDRGMERLLDLSIRARDVLVPARLGIRG
jgi:biopolymer transport protein ExbB/TolQ